MIEERIVISDANVIFDLLSVQLLEVFFALPCEICTTDLVISEIERPEQQQIIQKFIKSKRVSRHLFLTNLAKFCFCSLPAKTIPRLQIVPFGIMPKRLMDGF